MANIYVALVFIINEWIIRNIILINLKTNNKKSLLTEIGNINLKTMTPTKEQLLEFGIQLDRESIDVFEMNYLYRFDDVNYVILTDGTVITQEEDNACGPDFAIFPIKH